MKPVMRQAVTRVVGVVTMLLATAGCAPLTPRLDSDFAGAVRQAVTTQTRDRSAAARNAGMDAAGLDGVAAKEVMDRYQKSFRTPEATASVFTIGVSGGQGTP